jgi:hypothetical protein
MSTFVSKAGWVVATLLGITLLAAWAGIINAGTLDPPGPLGSTMKSLDDVPGSWNRMLSSSGADPCNTERFDCVLLNDAAVLDRETGLAWERTGGDNQTDWDSAIRDCHDRNVGNRGGWRLPAVAELLSLLDYDSVDGLPDGHPFNLTASTDTFWTSTRNTASSGRSMRVDLSDASVVDDLVDTPNRVLCVRGPGGGDVQ